MPLGETVALYGAISALFGVVSVLAKIAWSERAERVNKCEKENEYYRSQVMPALEKITDATEIQNRGLTVLTDVVRESLRRSDA